MIVTIVVVLSIPEGSNLQLFFPFLIGGITSYPQKPFISKLDVTSHHFLTFLWFAAWFFIVPDKMQSVLFLLGALSGRILKQELELHDP